MENFQRLQWVAQQCVDGKSSQPDRWTVRSLHVAQGRPTGRCTVIETSLKKSGLSEAVSGIAAGAFGPIAGAATSALLSLASAAIDYAVHYQENLSKQATELRSQYDELTTGIGELNDELATTRERMDELNSQDDLSVSDKQELANLQQSNSELTTRIELQKKLAAIKGRETNEAVLKEYAFDFEDVREKASSYLKKTVSGGGYTFQAGQNITEKDYYIEQLRRYRELEALGSGRSTVQENQFQTTGDYIIEAASRFNTFAEKLAVVDDESRELRDTWMALAAAGDTATSTAAAAYKRFSEVFDAQFPALKAQFLSLAAHGKLDASVIESYEELGEAIRAAGMSVPDVIDQFAALTEKARWETATQAADQFVSHIQRAGEITQSFQTAINGLASALEMAAAGQELTGKTIVDLLTKYPELDDAVIQTATGYRLNETAVRSLIAAQTAQYKLEVEEAMKSARKVLEAEGLKSGGYNQTSGSLLTLLNNELTYTRYSVRGMELSPEERSRRETALLEAIREVKAAQDTLNHVETVQKYLQDTERYTSKPAPRTTAPAANDALKNALKEINHRKAMGEYEQRELQYIADLTSAKQAYAKTQDERWDIDETIYQARLSYEQRLRQEAEAAQQEREEAIKAAEEAEKAAEEARQQALERQKDALSALQDLVKKRIEMIKSEKAAMLDAEKAKLDALRTEIDKRKELLDDQVRERDDSNELAAKNKAVSDLDARILALSNDTSAEGIKTRQALEEERVRRKQELEEYLANRSVDIQKQALDEQYEDSAEQYRKLESETQRYLSNNQILMEQAMQDLNGMTDPMYEKMIAWNKTYGDGINSHITEAWNAAKTALQDYGSAMDIQATFDKLDRAVGENTVLPSKTAQAAKPTPPARQPDQPPVTQPAAPRAAPAVGSTVTVKPTTTHFSARSGGKHVNSRVVPGQSFTVYQVSGKEILIGRNGVYTGWINLSDIQGYAAGAARIPEGQWARVDERGPELIARAAGRGRITYLEQGDAVLPATISERLLQLGRDPLSYLRAAIPVVGAASNVPRGAAAPLMQMGDIVIQGSADRETVRQLDNLRKRLLEDMHKEILSGLSSRGAVATTTR